MSQIGWGQAPKCHVAHYQTRPAVRNLLCLDNICKAKRWIKPSRDPSSPGSAEISAELSGFFDRKNHPNDPQEVHHPTPFKKCSKDQVSDPKLVDSGQFSDDPTICHMVITHHLSHGQISPPVMWSDLTISHVVRSDHLSHGQI